MRYSLHGSDRRFQIRFRNELTHESAIEIMPEVDVDGGLASYGALAAESPGRMEMADGDG